MVDARNNIIGLGPILGVENDQNDENIKKIMDIEKSIIDPYEKQDIADEESFDDKIEKMLRDIDSPSTSRADVPKSRDREPPRDRELPRDREPPREQKQVRFALPDEEESDIPRPPPFPSGPPSYQRESFYPREHAYSREPYQYDGYGHRYQDQKSYYDMENDKDDMLEEINQMRLLFKDRGVNVDNIPFVSRENSFYEVNKVYEMLRSKDDMTRFASIAEEGVAIMAKLAEKIFDGRTEFFGIKPNIVGWSDAAKIKMKSMRLDTSRFVKAVFTKNNLGAGSRVILELVPSMVLFSLEKNDDESSLIDERRYRDTLTKID